MFGLPTSRLESRRHTGFPVPEYGKACIVAEGTGVYNRLTAHKPTRSEAGAEYSNIRRLPFLFGLLVSIPTKP